MAAITSANCLHVRAKASLSERTTYRHNTAARDITVIRQCIQRRTRTPLVPFLRGLERVCAGHCCSISTIFTPSQSNGDKSRIYHQWAWTSSQTGIAFPALDLLAPSARRMGSSYEQIHPYDQESLRPGNPAPEWPRKQSLSSWKIGLAATRSNSSVKRKSLPGKVTVKHRLGNSRRGIWNCLYTNRRLATQWFEFSGIPEGMPLEVQYLRRRSLYPLLITFP